MNRIIPPLAATALLLAGLTGCAPAGPSAEQSMAPSESSNHDEHDHDDHDHESSEGHGEIEGAQETTEAPLHIVSIDSAGNAGMTDLLNGKESSLEAIAAPTSVYSDGRYVFASTAEGLSVIDSGMWSWAHGDHFHYYRATPRSLGTLAGGKDAAVTGSALSTAGGTGVFFRDTGRAVLLDNAELAEGHVHPTFEIDTGKHDGLVAPLGEGAVVSVPGKNGKATQVRFHGPDGQSVNGTEAECDQASDAITTAAGLVIGCADGALVVTLDGDGDGDEAPQYQRVAYPKGTKAGERASDFDGRKGRTSVAAVAGEHGAWVLDAREGKWQRILADVPLLRVSAVDDKDGHVVALDTAGRIHVQKLMGNEPAKVSEPLLAKTLADKKALAGVELVVDQQRAYLNDPAANAVHEIGFTDGARIARHIETPTAPDFIAETGR